MIEEELSSAVQLVNPRTEVLKSALLKIIKGIDTTGISVAVVDSISEFEAHVEALEKASISVMASEVDGAMLQSVDVLKTIITSQLESTPDKISAIKALGVIGGYVSKRREGLRPTRGVGNQINVVIDNNIEAASAESKAEYRIIEDDNE